MSEDDGGANDDETPENAAGTSESGDAEDERPGPGDSPTDGDSPSDGDSPEPGEVPLSSLRERIEDGRSRGREDGDGGVDADGVPDEDAPLSDVAEDVDGGAGEGGDPFDEMDVGDVDTEEVWESFVDEESEAVNPKPGAEVSPGGSAAEVAADATAGTEHVVEKRSFCQRCRFLSDPPETRCTNEGTEIVAVVDSEHFRVRNCPMVGEDERPDFEAGSGGD